MTGQRLPGGRGERGDVQRVPARVEGQATVVRRAEELEPERVRQQHHRDQCAGPEPAEEGPGEPADARRTRHRVGDGEQTAGQHQEYEHLLAEEHLVGDEQPEQQPAPDHPVGRRAEHQREDRRHQELRDHVQVAGGLGHHARGESAAEPTDGGGEPGPDQPTGEEEVPGGGGAGERADDGHQERGLRAEQQGHRGERETQAEHRGVGHQVDPVRGVECGAVERVLQVGHRVRGPGQHPLEEHLVVARPGGVVPVQPEPAGDVAGGQQVAQHDRQVDQPRPAAGGGDPSGTAAPAGRGASVGRGTGRGVGDRGMHRGLGRFHSPGRVHPTGTGVPPPLIRPASIRRISRSVRSGSGRPTTRRRPPAGRGRRSAPRSGAAVPRCSP